MCWKLNKRLISFVLQIGAEPSDFCHRAMPGAQKNADVFSNIGTVTIKCYAVIQNKSITNMERNAHRLTLHSPAK
ncbi:hypothetical protein [Yersinia wautersii]|uniref:hypothetical protein n=1 Tax=Yersinia wautersii TaxID=1341643 RepID=UPI00053ABF75|nr:hypothetical protein [Yersinia wautersii]